MTFSEYLSIVIPTILLLGGLGIFLMWSKAKYDKNCAKKINGALDEQALKENGFVEDRRIHSTLSVSASTRELIYLHDNGSQIISFDDIHHIHPSVSADKYDVRCSLGIYCKGSDGKFFSIAYFSPESPEILFENIEYLTLIAGRKLLKKPEEKLKQSGSISNTIDKFSKKLGDVGPDIT